MGTSRERASAGALLVGFAAVASLVLPAPGMVPAGSSRAPAPGTGDTLLRPASSLPTALRLYARDLALPPELVQAMRPASERATHTVVAGDTLWDIARSAGVAVEVLAAANGLSGNSILSLGCVLTIPAPGTPAPARPAQALRRPAVTLPPPKTQGGPAAQPAPAVAERLALLRPSGGTITSRFGWRVHPIFGGREFHTGIDIATRFGSPVIAARAGIVRFVGWRSGYGRIIVLDHGDGIETAYSHLSAVTVTPGDQVTEGQMIGRIGNSGWSTGPHLFFEVRRNGVPLDPTRYLN